MTSLEKFFSLLSVKDGMSDSRYFVGRKELLSNLSGCVFGDQRSPAWIYGPKRIGKSSVAQAIARKAKDSETTVIWVDCIDLCNRDIDQALQRTLEKSKFRTIASRGDTKKAFEKLAAASEKVPITIIFDEFDKVALNLKINDQAFLRRLATDYKRFCYVFISCLPPGNLVEEIPDIGSRILGICTQQRIMPLERRDIQELCKRVAEDLNQPKLKEIDSLVRREVGGFPVAVMAIVKKLAIAGYHYNTIENEEIEDLVQTAYQELEVDLKSYWASLQPETRSVLIGKAEEKQFERELKEDGFFNRFEGLISPNFLVRAGRENSHSTSDVSPIPGTNDIEVVISLFKFIADINHSLKLRGLSDGFYIGSRSCEFYRLIRQTCNEDEFRDAIGYLYRTFYEGAKERAGQKKYRLPQPLDEFYRKKEIVGDISSLRNFLSHDKTRFSDSEEPNRYFKEIGDIYERHCGHRDPNTDLLRKAVQKSILLQLHDLLGELYDKIKNL